MCVAVSLPLTNHSSAVVGKGSVQPDYIAVIIPWNPSISATITVHAEISRGGFNPGVRGFVGMDINAW